MKLEIRWKPARGPVKGRTLGVGQLMWLRLRVARASLWRRLATALVAITLTALSARAQWVDVTGNLSGMHSECGNLCLLSVVPGRDQILAGVAKQGLWSTTNGGASWVPLGEGAGSDVIVNRPSRIVYDPRDLNVFWESGIYNSFGVCQTTDGGRTFRRLGSITHNDNVSVNFSDPRRQLLLAGGHEQARTVWKSIDGGSSWTNIGKTLPEGTKFSSNPLFIDSQTYLVNASGWGNGTGGIYRTTDGGANWAHVSTLEPSGQPLEGSDGAIYWPLMYDRGLIASTNQGVSWFQTCGYGTIKSSQLIELPNHALAALGGRRVKTSTDRGATWINATEPAPFDPAGLAYAPARRAFFVWQWDCGDKVITNAIARWDYPLPPTRD